MKYFFKFWFNLLEQTEQCASLLTAEGRIVPVTNQITLAHTGYSLYFTMGRKMPPKLPLSLSPTNTWFLGPTRVNMPYGI